MNELRIGVDLGGTKIEVAALGADGEILARLRRSTPRGDYRGSLEVIRSLVTELEARLGARGTVGVGIPGALSPTSGRVKNANSTWLIGHPLDHDLATILDRPVRLANDADCFALSEAADGAGAGATSVFGVIIGTGTGGGIVVHGRLLAGPNAIAGEWGHNPLPWPQPDELPGPPCYCGQRGCIETWLSGPALAADHREVTGEERDAKTIAKRAAGGGEACEATLRRYESRMARALASVINLIDPAVIVLGGGLSNLDRLYRNVPERWGQWVFSDRVDTRLLKHRHGDSSGVRGAAWLWSD
ncbi:ROK family protein [Endothiovibrio diazotrophicus]